MVTNHTQKQTKVYIQGEGSSPFIRTNRGDIIKNSNFEEPQKPQDLIDVENHVLNSWPSSTEEEAKELIEVMVAHPTDAWRKLLSKARKNEIVHSELISENSTRIYESMAEYLASIDGTVGSPR